MRRWVGAGLLGAVFGVGGAGLALSAWAPSDALADAPKEGWPADPAPVASTKQWVFEVRAKDSEPSIVKVSEVNLEKAEATQRIMGRWALEFYVGNELLDRIRFNVPLAGDAPNEKAQPGKRRPVFKVNTRFFVRMADQPRATFVRLVDRATGDIRLFSWPPDKDGKLTPKAAPVAADAGASSSADAGTPDAGASTDAGAKDGGATDAGDAGRFTPDKP